MGIRPERVGGDWEGNECWAKSCGLINSWESQENFMQENDINLKH